MALRSGDLLDLLFCLLMAVFICLMVLFMPVTQHLIVGEDLEQLGMDGAVKAVLVCIASCFFHLYLAACILLKMRKWRIFLKDPPVSVRVVGAMLSVVTSITTNKYLKDDRREMTEFFSALRLYLLLFRVLRSKNDYNLQNSSLGLATSRITHTAAAKVMWPCYTVGFIMYYLRYYLEMGREEKWRGVVVGAAVAEWGPAGHVNIE